MNSIKPKNQWNWI